MNRQIPVNIHQLIRKNPDHQDCDLEICRSGRNQRFTGLYCRDHEHWLQWLNSEQVAWLVKLGVDWHTWSRPRPMIHARDIFG